MRRALVAQRQPRMAQIACVLLMFDTACAQMSSNSTSPTLSPAPTVSPASTTVDQHAQRELLMQLFEATNGREWTSSEFWNTSAPVCEWFGVSCDDDEHVIGILLPKNNLCGPLPAALANLSWMTDL